MAIEPPENLSLDMDDLTFGDLELLEEHLGGFGAALTDAGELDLSKLPMLKSAIVLTFLAARKVIPGLTMDDVRAWPIDAIDLDLFNADEPPSPPGSGGS